VRITARLEAFGGWLKSDLMVLDRAMCSGMRLNIPYYKPFRPVSDEKDITAENFSTLTFEWRGRTDGDTYIFELVESI
jgi:hypothetical protein